MTNLTLKSIVDERDDLCFPILIRDGKVAVYRITQSESTSYFGGKLSELISAPKHSIVHSVATIDTKSCELLNDISEPFLHLLYAFRHDGGDIKYKINSKVIKIGKVKPKLPDEDWPCENYPDFFPVKPLECWGVIDSTEDEISELFHQYIDLNEPNKIIAVIPPSEHFGVSLWGECGDAEMVHCIFEYDITSNTIETSNQCG